MVNLCKLRSLKRILSSKLIICDPAHIVLPDSLLAVTLSYPGVWQGSGTLDSTVLFRSAPEGKTPDVAYLVRGGLHFGPIWADGPNAITAVRSGVPLTTCPAPPPLQFQ